MFIFIYVYFPAMAPTLFRGGHDLGLLYSHSKITSRCGSGGVSVAKIGESRPRRELAGRAGEHDEGTRRKRKWEWNWPCIVPVRQDKDVGHRKRGRPHGRDMGQPKSIIVVNRDRE